MRDHDVRTLAASELERTRRDLAASLALVRPDSPTRVPILRAMTAVDAELAEQADREIAAGRYRGPLHGIPWGAKDLIAYPGYRTTWGAAPYRDQVLHAKATVAQRLEL